jgi:hypothetical protein
MTPAGFMLLLAGTERLAIRLVVLSTNVSNRCSAGGDACGHSICLHTHYYHLALILLRQNYKSPTRSGNIKLNATQQK